MTEARQSSVAVVMSTYNGAAHVVEQLESILSQDYPNVRVVVRDDGSKDDTVSVLEPYEREGAITLVRGENKGVVGSFIELIQLVADQVDYVSLCDQDDVWHPDKVSRAVEVLEARDQTLPQLYCSEYVFCDADMHPTGRSRLNVRGVGFATMLYENRVSGNTTVINRTLARLVAQAGPEGVYCHDWWLGLVACALGELTFDDFASLDYRRTGQNVSPTGSGGLSLLRYRLRTFFEKGQLSLVTTQLRQLREDFGPQMNPDRLRLLGRFLDGGRLSKAFSPIRLRQLTRDELALRVLFLCGLL